jgi:hypothetical protein
VKRRILESFIGNAGEGHHCIRTKDGVVREGWIIAVGDTTLTFMHAPSPFFAQATGGDEMAPADEEILLEDVTAWMNANKEWIAL